MVEFKAPISYLVILYQTSLANMYFQFSNLSLNMEVYETNLRLHKWFLVSSVAFYFYTSF